MVFSDIHNDWRALKRLLDIEADYYFAAGDLVSWEKGLDQAGELLKRRAGKVYVIPGNHEAPRQITAFCSRFGFVDFHGQTIRIGDVHVAGLGCSSPTPFDTPGEYSETKFEAKLEPFRGLKPLIMICHCPPQNTGLDRAGPGMHFGSQALRDFIDREQPLYYFCGHIHEAEGVTQRMGITVAANVGKRGFLLDLGKLEVQRQS